MKDLQIAFFDSGMGGLSVLKRAIEMYPYEKYIYYADTLNAPYGNLSKEKIYLYTYNSVKKILKLGVKAVVLACNTATNAGIVRLRTEFSGIDIIGMEPALKPAYEEIKSGKILVLGTTATLQQAKFRMLFNKYNGGNIILSPQNNLAMDIENNFFNEEFLCDKLQIIFKDYKDYDIKGIVLGCTHYSLVKSLMRKTFVSAEIFDGNEGTVINLFRTLKDKNLISIDRTKSVEIFTSCGKNSKKEQYLKILNSF